MSRKLNCTYSHLNVHKIQIEALKWQSNQILRMPEIVHNNTFTLCVDNFKLHKSWNDSTKCHRITSRIIYILIWLCSLIVHWKLNSLFLFLFLLFSFFGDGANVTVCQCGGLMCLNLPNLKSFADWFMFKVKYFLAKLIAAHSSSIKYSLLGHMNGLLTPRDHCSIRLFANRSIEICTYSTFVTSLNVCLLLLNRSLYEAKKKHTLFTNRHESEVFSLRRELSRQ